MLFLLALYHVLHSLVLLKNLHSIQITKIMKATPLFFIWAISFALMALFANSMNIMFWLSLIAFASCSVYMTKHRKRLEKELLE